MVAEQRKSMLMRKGNMMLRPKKDRYPSKRRKENMDCNYFKSP